MLSQNCTPIPYPVQDKEERSRAPEHRSCCVKSENPGWGTWIRTRTDGVRDRCSTVKLFPKNSKTLNGCYRCIYCSVVGLLSLSCGTKMLPLMLPSSGFVRPCDAYSAKPYRLSMTTSLRYACWRAYGARHLDSRISKFAKPHVLVLSDVENTRNNLWEIAGTCRFVLIIMGSRLGPLPLSNDKAISDALRTCKLTFYAVTPTDARREPVRSSLRRGYKMRSRPLYGHSASSLLPEKQFYRLESAPTRRRPYRPHV